MSQRQRDLFLFAAFVLAFCLYMIHTAAPTSTSPPPTTTAWAPTGTLHVGDGDAISVSEETTP